MKKLLVSIIIAFLISLIIHILLYFVVDENLQNSKLQINTTNKLVDNKKNGLTSVKFVKLKKKEIKPKKSKVLIKKKIKKPIKKTKKVITKKNIKTKKVIAKKKVKTILLPSRNKQVDLKKLFTIQEPIKNNTTKSLEKQKEQEELLEVEELKELDSLTQSYIKLYGKKYFTFSKNQKRYLKQNLNKIGKITQNYLTYPPISIKTKQQGINIVEFFIHPNGDITDLKITDSSYYTALDSNTIETIELSYKDYPKPLEKVKIRIYVKYILE